MELLLAVVMAVLVLHQASVVQVSHMQVVAVVVVKVERLVQVAQVVALQVQEMIQTLRRELLIEVVEVGALVMLVLVVL
jgi:hypothetical protein